MTINTPEQNEAAFRTELAALLRIYHVELEVEIDGRTPGNDVVINVWGQATWNRDNELMYSGINVDFPNSFGADDIAPTS